MSRFAPEPSPEHPAEVDLVELRNALTVVHGFVALVLDDPVEAPSARHADWLGRALAAADQAAASASGVAARDGRQR